MCSFGSGGNSAPTTQFSTQTTTADPRAAQMYGQAWQTAQNAANRPFQPYSYDPNAFAAPLNPTQLQAIGNISGLQNAASPFYQAGANMVGNAGNTSSASLLPQYMNPYMSNVVDPVRGAITQQQALQTQNMNTDQIKAGAFGQERGALSRAVLAGQHNLGMGQALSPLYQDAFKTGLGAASNDLTRQLQAGQTMGQLGQGYTQTGLGAAQALLGAGTLGQTTQQKGLDALYNQYMMQQQYPFQTAQFLASVAGGLGPGYGGTTSGYQNSQQPLSFFGNPLSDPRLKTGARGDRPEVIGETHDGQSIYRYRLADPDTGELGPAQIGLMADEVERRRPDAIGDYNGYRTVDYAKATDRAARMGGGVRPEGGDYASGGIVPQFNMPTASLATPTLSYMQPEQKQRYGIGDALKDAVGLYNFGKEAKGDYDQLSDMFQSKSTGEPTRLPGANYAEMHDPESVASGEGYYASGGALPYSTDANEAEMRHGPGDFNMPTAKLNAPELQFSSPQKQQEGLGLGDAIGLGKTVLALGMKAAPYLASMSDRRLKTGVRPSRADGGGVFDDIVNALSGHGYVDGSTWEGSGVGSPVDITPALHRATGVAPRVASPRPARHAGVAPRGDWRREISMLQDNVNRIDPERELGTYDRLSPEEYAAEQEMARSHDPIGRLVGLGSDMSRAAFRHGGRHSDEDLDYVARTLIKEAGGEGDEGMRAVADVIRNRLHSGKYGDSAKDVVLAPKQFSPWNEEARGTKADPRGIDPGSSLYARARGIGGEELAGDNDITGGAMNFYNPKLASPKWAQGKGGLDIGHHRFLDASGAPGAGLKPTAYAGSEGAPSAPGLEAISRMAGVKPSAAADDDSAPAAGITGFLRGTRAQGLGERAGDFLTSERFLVPLLTGLGTMASSGSRYLAPAILQGIGAGAKAYMEVPQVQAETALKQAEAKNKNTLNRKFEAEGKSVEMENFMKSFMKTPYGNFVFLKNGMPVSQSEYMEMARSGNPPELLGSVPTDAMDMVKKGVETTGGAQPEEGQPRSATDIPQPAAKPPVSPPGVYDDKSSSLAKEEKKLVFDQGLNAEAAAKTTEQYRNYVNGEVTGARENAPYVKELSTTLADAYARHGFDEPGFASTLRSDVSSFANTLYHSLGGDPSVDLSKLKDSNDIVNKISTLLATQRSAAGGQHAYAALEAIKAAIPNLEMDKGAGAELTAQLMTLQQRAVDREAHLHRYMDESGGFAGKAGADFNDPSRASRYQKEQKVLKDLMLNEPVVLKKMMSGTVSPEKIQAAIIKIYGKKAPSEMWRYFSPSNG